jgi:hypothetical protein
MGQGSQIQSNLLMGSSLGEKILGYVGVCCITSQLRQRVGHCPKIIEKFRLKWGDNDNFMPLFYSISQNINGQGRRHCRAIVLSEYLNKTRTRRGKIPAMYSKWDKKMSFTSYATGP